MAYDRKTYGNSPFGNSVATPHRRTPVSRRRGSSRTLSDAEALSDQMGDPMGEQMDEQTADQTGDQTGDQLSDQTDADTEGTENNGTAPALPTGYGAAAVRPTGVSFFYLPKGRVTGLNLLGEALGWLMAWGTVGFFRAYVPAAVLMVFDGLFNPYGMAAITFMSAIALSHLLRRYQLKIMALRQLATTAIEYGETHHRADTQNQIDELLSAAAEKSENASQWLVSWLTALGALFIIGAFY